MISYSDYVLAERPWAYWPLNELRTANETQDFLDISGNERHLHYRPLPIGEVVTLHTFTHNPALPNFPSDSLPVRGLAVLGDNYESSSTVYESNGCVYLPTSTDAHLNDVQLDGIPFGMTHQLYRRKLRAEFIMGFPISIAFNRSGCKNVKYPIFQIGGAVMWMNTAWFKPCDNCSCQARYSRLTMSYLTRVEYHQNQYTYTSMEYQPIWSSGYIINNDPEMVCLSDNHCFMATEANGSGFLAKPKRMILEMEYFNDRHMTFKIIINAGEFPKQIISSDITFSADVELWNGHLVKRTFTFSEHYMDVSLLCMTGGISNLAIFFDKELDDQYLTRSWIALNAEYVPGLSLDLTEISDNLYTNVNQGYMANATAMQLDNLLIRGISHQRFTNIYTEDIDGGGSRVKLDLGSYYNSKYVKSILVQDYKIGDIISLDGSGQAGLNGCWRIEELEFNSPVFTTTERYEDESGYFIAKRAPIGGGAWTRTANFSYRSSESTLDSVFNLFDTNQSWAVASLENRSVNWKRMLKRYSSHYLGGDVDYDRAHWTILGDSLRFILVIAYKQNPKSHSRVLVFGDFNDPNDNQIKTVLIGYINSQIGDVGFNKIFEYFEPVFSDRGILHLTLRSHQPSGIGWIYSNKEGDIDYLHGTKDCGQHRYQMPPYPLT